MATERTLRDSRTAAQASVLRAWGQDWRRANGKSQQQLGRAAGYGSDESPKSAAVAISRIEAGKTDPAGRHRQRLLDALGHTEEELERETVRALAAPPRHGAFARALAGPVHVENGARRAQIIAASNLLTERVTFQFESSARVLERARSNFILPFLETAAQVDWQPLLENQHASASGARGTNGASRASSGAAGSVGLDVRGLREQTQVNILKSVTESAARVIAGAGRGAGAAAGVFVVVSAAGTASTGTAIASRSGAAASSATLAWLGGGSLAAGGMGVAGSAAALTGIVALPVLLAVGAVLVWKGRNLRREAEAEAEKLEAAQQALEGMEEAWPRAERWNTAQQAIIQRAELLGRIVQSQTVETLMSADGADNSEGRIEWEKLSLVTREALEVELKLLSIILDTQALPVWLGVTTVNEPELTATQEKTATVSGEWIDESLTFAQFELDEHEVWVRSRMAQDRPGEPDVARQLPPTSASI